MPKRNEFIGFQAGIVFNFFLSIKTAGPVFVNVTVHDSGRKSSDDLSYASTYRPMIYIHVLNKYRLVIFVLFMKY
jgi:hypothetical protein